MRCPNPKCKRETRRVRIKFTREGKKIEGCPSCVSGGDFERVHTGRKVWTGHEVYGAEKCQEMDQEWGQKLIERAANPRRHMAQRGQR